MNSKVDISVIICCYNSEKLLEPTLRHIADQKVPDGFFYEIILVDNNSNDSTAMVAVETWNSLKAPFRLHVVKESNPGLSNARKAGVFKSSAEILVFCDDDNWLDPEYLHIASDFMRNNPSLGALGGQSKAILEGVKPPWWHEYSTAYAVGKQAEISGDISDRKYLWGAGLVMRRSILIRLYHSKFNSMLLGRKGKILGGGDDSEYCKWLLLMGYKLWYLEKLKFIHYITERRLTKEYLDAMLLGHTEAHEILKVYDWYLHWLNINSSIKNESWQMKKAVKYLVSGIKRTDRNWKLKLQYLLQTKLKIDPILFQIIKTHRLIKRE